MGSKLNMKITKGSFLDECLKDPWKKELIYYNWDLLGIPDDLVSKDDLFPKDLDLLNTPVNLSKPTISLDIEFFSHVTINGNLILLKGHQIQVIKFLYNEIINNKRLWIPNEEICNAINLMTEGERRIDNIFRKNKNLYGILILKNKGHFTLNSSLFQAQET